jgi:outer membrane receptor for ferrienterochelin and colicins
MKAERHYSSPRFRHLLEFAGVSRTLVGLCALMLSLISLSGFAHAQTPDDLTKKSLEDLMNIEVASVYSASKHSQKVTEAPASVSIVTADQIARYGYRTLAEVLTSVRGFYSSSDRNYTYVGVRGFARPGDYNTRILLMVDGHRINDNVYDQAFLGREFPVEIDLIERVEIVRGASSSLYGTSAFFAVINVITKRGRDINGVEVSGEAASFGTYKGRVSFGKKFNDKLELLASGSFYDSKGQRELYFKEFDSPATNNGIAINADDENLGNFFANVAYRDLTVRATYGRREKGIPTGSYGTLFNDPRTQTTDRRGYIEAQYEHTFDSGFGLVARGSYDSYRYDGTYIYDYSDNEIPFIAENQDYSRGSWWSGELQLSKSVRNHKLTLGTEFRDNLRQDQGNYDLEPRTVYLDDQRKSRNVALFAQDEFSIRENLVLSGGLRFDHHSTFGGTAKPRVALIYHPAPKTTFKVLYGEAFRAPNAYELYFSSSETFKKNPDLQPETIRTSEVIFEKYIGDHFRISASGYIYRLKGLITQVTSPDGSIVFENEDRIASKGFEFELESKLPRGLEGYAAYTIQKTHDQATGLALTNSPRHLVKANFSAPFANRKVFAGFQFQYAGARTTLNGTKVDSSYVTNFTLLSRKIAKHLDLSFGAYNLFNQKFSDPGAEEHLQNSIEQDGRNFRLKFTYHF